MGEGGGTRLLLLVGEALVLLVGEALVLLVGEALVLLVGEALVFLVGEALVLLVAAPSPVGRLVVEVSGGGCGSKYPPIPPTHSSDIHPSKKKSLPVFLLTFFLL